MLPIVATAKCGTNRKLVQVVIERRDLTVRFLQTNIDMKTLLLASSGVLLSGHPPRASVQFPVNRELALCG